MDWPASSVEQMPISRLFAYAKNARTHSEAQVSQIAASMREWGWTNPVLADEDGQIIAGHGRILAAKQIGIDSVPVMTARGWTDAQKRAYVLADNQLALNAQWDDAVLREEIVSLGNLGFDTELIGFSADELSGILAPSSADAKGDGSKVPEAQATVVWRDWARELLSQFAALAEREVPPVQGITPAYARWCFLRSLYDGASYPNHCSLAFHAHQMRCAGDSHSFLEGLARIVAGTAKSERLRFIANGEMNARSIVAGSLPFSGARMPIDFPADLARALYNEFAPQGAAVLDPCHGWGGRIVGFLLSNTAASYVGFDPSPETHDGALALENALHEFVIDKKTSLHCSCFEDAKKLPVDHFDFALTSPPYYDVEHYIGGSQSHTRYSTYDEWRDGFYRALIEKTYRALKRGAFFALQVGAQRYPLVEDAKSIARAVGFSFDGSRSAAFQNVFHETEAERAEQILILRKS